MGVKRKFWSAYVRVVRGGPSEVGVDRWVSTEVNSFHEDYLCRRQQGSTGCF
jgi:hypothetical protein